MSQALFIFLSVIISVLVVSVIIGMYVAIMMSNDLFDSASLTISTIIILCVCLGLSVVVSKGLFNGYYKVYNYNDKVYRYVCYDDSSSDPTKNLLISRNWYEVNFEITNITSKDMPVYIGKFESEYSNTTKGIEEIIKNSVEN
jgi:type III secretory pathway component EscS